MSNRTDFSLYDINLKWRKGFECRKCGYTNFCSGKTPHSR
jgi:radical SAM protein with 4Fe4S-binding SPASM domain